MTDGLKNVFLMNTKGYTTKANSLRFQVIEEQKQHQPINTLCKNLEEMNR